MKGYQIPVLMITGTLSTGVFEVKINEFSLASASDTPNTLVTKLIRISIFIRVI
jgi:hypothetical protein